jgi:hypothetical protein
VETWEPCLRKGNIGSTFSAERIQSTGNGHLCLIGVLEKVSNTRHTAGPAAPSGALEATGLASAECRASKKAPEARLGAQVVVARAVDAVTAVIQIFLGHEVVIPISDAASTDFFGASFREWLTVIISLGDNVRRAATTNLDWGVALEKGVPNNQVASFLQARAQATVAAKQRWVAAAVAPKHSLDGERLLVLHPLGNGFAPAVASHRLPLK